MRKRKLSIWDRWPEVMTSIGYEILVMNQTIKEMEEELKNRSKGDKDNA